MSKVLTGKMADLPDEIPAYISIDPGITTGITYWDDKGRPTHYNEIDIDTLNRLLDILQEEYYAELREYPLKQIIVEEFVLYQKLALQQSGSRLETVQVIGMIKRFNHCINLPPVVEVRADTKEIAAKWSGMPIPKGKNSHIPNWKASYLIGYWWLHHVAKIIPARVLGDF
jgi:hypothetical protein